MSQAEASSKDSQSSSVSPGVSQTGKASWYGPGFHGRRTASGERFNQNVMTAAHRHLPFGTRVRVTNHRSGRSVVVRINDRGPFIRGRIIDLSRASAHSLGLAGLSSVTITVL
ncbi:MAG: septal ring lytic transglycosylase RlpA family protein [Beijerinckiaceae bacterium]|nr:septal ring lytic transglycosylase RlpA family protein [Beijerinckiaceae bacterium]